MEEISGPAPQRRLARIVLTGSESVGKSTLASELAAHFGALLVPEFVRDYAAAKNAPLGFDDHGPIAFGQMALEDDVIAQTSARGDTLLLQDTDLVSTVVYCHHYFGRCPAFIEEAAVARLATRYLLLDIDVPWVADGVRDRGDRREEVQSLFRQTLHRFQASVTTIRGDWTARRVLAIAEIDALR